MSHFAFNIPDFCHNEIVSVREFDPEDFDDLKFPVDDLKYEYLVIPTVWSEETEKDKDLKKFRRLFEVLRIEMVLKNALTINAFLNCLVGSNTATKKGNRPETIRMLVEDLNQKIPNVLGIPVNKWKASGQLTLNKFLEMLRKEPRREESPDPYREKANKMIEDPKRNEISRSRKSIIDGIENCLRVFTRIEEKMNELENIISVWKKMRESIWEAEKNEKRREEMEDILKNVELNWRMVLEKKKTGLVDQDLPPRPFLTNVFSTATFFITKETIKEKLEKIEKEWSEILEWSRTPAIVQGPVLVTAAPDKEVEPVESGNKVVDVKSVESTSQEVFDEVFDHSPERIPMETTSAATSTVPSIVPSPVASAAPSTVSPAIRSAVPTIVPSAETSAVPAQQPKVYEPAPIPEKAPSKRKQPDVPVVPVCPILVEPAVSPPIKRRNISESNSTLSISTPQFVSQNISQIPSSHPSSFSISSLLQGPPSIQHSQSSSIQSTPSFSSNFPSQYTDNTRAEPQPPNLSPFPQIPSNTQSVVNPILPNMLTAPPALIVQVSLLENPLAPQKDPVLNPLNVGIPQLPTQSGVAPSNTLNSNPSWEYQTPLPSFSSYSSPLIFPKNSLNNPKDFPIYPNVSPLLLPNASISSNSSDPPSLFLTADQQNQILSQNVHQNPTLLAVYRQLLNSRPQNPQQTVLITPPQGPQNQYQHFPQVAQPFPQTPQQLIHTPAPIPQVPDLSLQENMRKVLENLNQLQKHF